VEGWAEADLYKIFDATAPIYWFTDPLVGSFSGRSLHGYFHMLHDRFSRAGAITKHELAFFLRGTREERAYGTGLRFWRESPVIGLTGVAEIELGPRGVIAERVVHDGNLAFDRYAAPYSDRSDVNSFQSCRRLCLTIPNGLAWNPTKESSTQD
jgi:hypothetical protein